MRYFGISIRLISLSICLFSMPCAHALLDSIVVSGNPAPMTINTAFAGSQPSSVTDSSTTYGASTLLASRKITGSLTSDMPSNVTLEVNLQAPLGATSQGFVVLQAVSSTLVTGLNLAVLTTGLSITYRLSATVAANKVSNATDTVTFTIGP